jgi:tRNA-specific 2-thiouridylase
MKFDLLLGLLRKYKADFVATGHYARLRRKRKTQNAKRKIEEGFFYGLVEAADKNKDQSYFLYKLSQEELSRIIFPLGDLLKAEVKKLAKKFRLPVLDGKESQDICFLPDRGINSFLKKYIRSKRGDIIDDKGNIIGCHKGLPFYTIGQRKGIEIGGKGPFFVIAKNGRKNQLIVSSDPEKLMTEKFEIKQTSWIEKDAKFPLKAKVQIRYHSEKIPAIIGKAKRGRISVKTEKPVRAVTPGQSAVFFEKDKVLGGGTIVS